MTSEDFCFCFKQKAAYEMRISDWSSDVCSSDLRDARETLTARPPLGDRAVSGVAAGSLPGRLRALQLLEQLGEYLLGLAVMLGGLGRIDVGRVAAHEHGEHARSVIRSEDSPGGTDWVCTTKSLRVHYQ